MFFFPRKPTISTFTQEMGGDCEQWSGGITHNFTISGKKRRINYFTFFRISILHNVSEKKFLEFTLGNLFDRALKY